MRNLFLIVTILLSSLSGYGQNGGAHAFKQQLLDSAFSIRNSMGFVRQWKGTGYAYKFNRAAYSNQPVVGTWSVDFTDNNISGKGAKGNWSFAQGYNSEASGNVSIAMGSQAAATGPNTVAIGQNAQAFYNGGVALGSITTAAGGGATALGYSVQQNAFGGTVVGRYNHPILSEQQASMVGIVSPLFIVGTGTGTGSSRKNGLVVYSNDDVVMSGALTAQSVRLTSLQQGVSTSTSAGTVGDIRFTPDYIYICIGTNEWKRVAISTW